MADYELIGLNEAAPDLRAPTSADRGVVVGGVLVEGLAELDGGADIDGVRVATVSDTNPLARAIAVQMTAAASGSSGIQVAQATDINVGTNDFTVDVIGSMPSFSVATGTGLYFVYQNASNFWYCGLNVSGVMRIFVRVAGVTILDASAPLPSTTGKTAKFTYVITRETTSTAGSVAFYFDGAPLGTTVISASSPTSYPSGNLFIFGSNAARIQSSTQASRLFNRALTAAEVLDLSINGVALADRGASQTAVYTSDFSAGVDGWVASSQPIAGNIDGIGGEDNWLQVTRTSGGAGGLTVNIKAGALTPNKNNRISIKFHNPSGSGITHLGIGGFGASGVVAIAEGTTATLNVKNALISSAGLATISPRDANGAAVNVANGIIYYLKEVVSGVNGLTSELLASNAQSNTGQIFDTSGNKNHALLPASGATVVGRPVSQAREVRWTNTWAGTNELQYIGGVNQAILPATAAQQFIDVIASGVVTLNLGDGSDPDRYVAAAVLAAGRNRLTLASPFADGTNLKMTATPASSFTGTLEFTAVYHVLED